MNSDANAFLFSPKINNSLFNSERSWCSEKISVNSNFTQKVQLRLHFCAQPVWSGLPGLPLSGRLHSLTHWVVLDHPVLSDAFLSSLIFSPWWIVWRSALYHKHSVFRCVLCVCLSIWPFVNFFLCVLWFGWLWFAVRFLHCAEAARCLWVLLTEESCFLGSFIGVAGLCIYWNEGTCLLNACRTLLPFMCMSIKRL